MAEESVEFIFSESQEFPFPLIPPPQTDPRSLDLKHPVKAPSFLEKSVTGDSPVMLGN